MPLNVCISPLPCLYPVSLLIPASSVPGLTGKHGFLSFVYLRLRTAAGPESWLGPLAALAYHAKNRNLTLQPLVSQLGLAFPARDWERGWFIPSSDTSLVWSRGRALSPRPTCKQGAHLPLLGGHWAAAAAPWADSESGRLAAGRGRRPHGLRPAAPRLAATVARLPASPPTPFPHSRPSGGRHAWRKAGKPLSNRFLP